MNNYVICTVQRSGKSWIAETLNMLGLGYAVELLTEFQRGSAPEQTVLEAEFDEAGMFGLARSFAAQSITAGFPCASMTLQWSDFDAKDDFEIIHQRSRQVKLQSLIAGLSPCVVFFLQRRDPLSQAISHFFAGRSGYYHSSCPEERRERRSLVRYDRGEIDRYLRYTRRCYAEWHNLFAYSELQPVEIYYEDFVDDPVRWFNFLGNRIAGSEFDAATIASASSVLTKLAGDAESAFHGRYLAGD